MQITSQFEPFDNIMQPQTTFWTKHDFSKMIFKSGDNPIYGNPLGSNTHILNQFTINIGVNYCALSNGLNCEGIGSIPRECSTIMCRGG